MQKKVLVISHERSGTHFLINSLAENFGYVHNQIDIDRSQGVNWADSRELAAWFSRYNGVQIPNVFKSHHTSAFFRPCLEMFADEYQLFYIYRDGRDVLTSFWHYLNRLAQGWGPQTKTVGAFLRAHPAGGITQYQDRDFESMVIRWAAHVEGWHSAGANIHFVSYEALHTQFEQTMAGIAPMFGAAADAEFKRPGKDAPSSLPWKGKPENWKRYFTHADLQCFNEHAGKAMRLLGYEL